MQITLIDVHNTSVERIHEHICDTAVDIANASIAIDTRIPKKYRGPAIRNGAPYNEGRLVLEIAEEHSAVPDNVKAIYRTLAAKALKEALVRHKDLFAGMILGEAKAGRNYFNRWQQAPTRLF